MSNIEDQIADIRERVASIETQISCIFRTLDGRKENGGGNIVLPVAAVITILEIVKVVIEKVT